MLYQLFFAVILHCKRLQDYTGLQTLTSVKYTSILKTQKFWALNPKIIAVALITNFSRVDFYKRQLLPIFFFGQS